MITLQRIDINDSQKLKAMQEIAFSQLLNTYKDYDTSPACESLDTIKSKITSSDFYFINLNNISVGAIRIVNKSDSCRISPVFILSEYRNRGFATKAMLLAESMYPHIKKWELDTIMQEQNLVSLYKHIGYVPTGEMYDITQGMTIMFMEKFLKK